MRSLRLGPWLLVAWYEHVSGGNEVEIREVADAARLLRRVLASVGPTSLGPISLRAFVRELDGGAAFDSYDEELVDRLAVMIARRRVRVVNVVEIPIVSEPVERIEYTPEFAPTKDEVADVEPVDWTTELETDDPVWFEIAAEIDELPAFSADTGLEELPAFSADLSTGQT